MRKRDLFDWFLMSLCEHLGILLNEDGVRLHTGTMSALGRPGHSSLWDWKRFFDSSRGGRDLTPVDRIHADRQGGDSAGDAVRRRLGLSLSAGRSGCGVARSEGCRKSDGRAGGEKGVGGGGPDECSPSGEASLGGAHRVVDGTVFVRELDAERQLEGAGVGGFGTVTNCV